MLLVANAPVALPALPAGFATSLRNGTPVNTPGWQTVGCATLNDVRPNLERFPSAILRARLNNADASRALVTDLVADLTTVAKGRAAPYPGRVRLVLPAALQVDGALQQLTEGLSPAQESGDFLGWATQQRKLLVNNQPGTYPSNDVFVQQQIDEVDQIRAPGMHILRAARNASRVAVRKIVIQPGASVTVFLLLDRPKQQDYPAGRAFNVALMQLDAGTGTVLGGLSGRIELAWPAIYHPGMRSA